MKSIVRVDKHTDNYVIIDNTALEDSRISFKAKGILAYLLSKPDNWTVRIQDLINHSPSDGIESIQNGLKELADTGYAVLERGGNTPGSRWRVFERPKSDKAETPTSGKPPRGEKPIMGKTHNGQTALLSNTDSIARTDKDSKEGNTPVPASPSPEELIYREYPLKAGKPNALRAIKKALKEHKFEYLLAKTKEYAEIRGGDLAFVPHPATWFNQERFNDSPSTWYPDRGKATTAPIARKGAPCEENNWTTAAW